VVAPQRELHSGVEILRCAGTRLNKDVTLFKVLNAITLSLSIFLSQLRRFRRDDCVVVVTNPPIPRSSLRLLRGSAVPDPSS
jgi:hypothetical protein